MLDFRLAIWQVGFYLAQMTSPIGQMTSWILPWPNDKSDQPNDKLDFTLTKWQVRSAKWQVGFYLDQMTSLIGRARAQRSVKVFSNAEETFFFQKLHLFLKCISACFWETLNLFKLGATGYVNLSSGFWLFKLGATKNVNLSSGFWLFKLGATKNVNSSSGFWLFKLGATKNVNSSSGFWTFLIKYVKFRLKSPKYDKNEKGRRLEG